MKTLNGFKRVGHGVWLVVKGLLITTFALIAIVLALVAGGATYFFSVNEINISGHQIRRGLDLALPENIEISFEDANLRILKPDGLPLSKYISLNIAGFCVRYEKEAVNSCLDQVVLGIAGGFSGEREKDLAFYIPQINWIDPIQMLGGKALVDLPKFPESEEPEEESSFDIVQFLRLHVLPKWRIQGSRIEVADLQIITEPKAGYAAGIDLTTDGNEVRLSLKGFEELQGTMKAQALIRLVRPENWLEDPGVQAETPRIWKLFVDGGLDLDRKSGLKVKADADIESSRSLDFRVSTNFRGIAGLREARLEGALKEQLFDGLFSLKVGARGESLQALDFVNCRIGANLEAQTGNLGCGPDTVRLQIREASFLRKKQFFTFHPKFELKVTRILFGETKEADFDFDFQMDHFDILSAQAKFSGGVLSAPNENLRYNVTGDLNLVSSRFQSVVNLLRETIYSVPAPLNSMDGPMAVAAQVQVNEEGGAIRYQTSTRFDSPAQAMHLRFEGETQLVKAGDSLVPRTNANLFIDDLRLSAPRLDLAVPPAFAPDSRFGPIVENRSEQIEEDQGPPMDFRLRIQTTRPQAIRIATNLTKAPIPIDVDLTYDAKGPGGSTLPAPQPPPEVDTVSGATMSANEAPVLSGQPVQARAMKTPEELAQPPVITGSVIIGRTPVELFKRDAALEQLRVDLTNDGAQRLNGQVSVNYLDYRIMALILGEAQDPQVRLSSDPPLDDDQILSVLLFGRTMDDLAGDERDSVANTKAAVTNAALGLSSLYLLASTPIESVGYDAEHGLVTAKVGIGGGASLELGSGTQNQSVGVTKRISRQFVLRSEVLRVGATGKRTVSAFLEWVKRF